jgi:Bacterial PH domain
MTSASDSSSVTASGPEGPASGLEGPTAQPDQGASPLPAAPAPAQRPGPGSGATINETVIYEGGPALGDLIVNLLFGLTIIGIPFAVAAIVRALWVRYRITSRRITVNGGWLGRERTQVVYSQIREVRSVPRGFGSWGDMVLVLDDGSKLEMRAMPRFRELEATIEERRRSSAKPSKGQGSRPSSGFTPLERNSA